MITVTKNNYIQDKMCRFSLVGMAEDEKPIGAFQERKIQNGSTFLEMDTGKLYFYNAEEDSWLAFPGTAAQDISGGVMIDEVELENAFYNVFA